MKPDLVTARIPANQARAWALGYLTDADLLLMDRPQDVALFVAHLGGGAAGVRLLREELARVPVAALVFRAAHSWGLARGCQRTHEEGKGWFRYWAGPLQLGRWILTRQKKTPSLG